MPDAVPDPPVPHSHDHPERYQDHLHLTDEKTDTKSLSNLHRVTSSINTKIRICVQLFLRSPGPIASHPKGRGTAKIDRCAKRTAARGRELWRGPQARYEL